MCSSELEFRLLGPVTVLRAGTEVALGGPRQRLVLALLLLDAGRPVPGERLVDEIWGDVAPATGTGPLRTYIWQLRRALTGTSPGTGAAGVDEPLVSQSTGYLLDVDPEQIDAVRFERLFGLARAAARPERALDLLDEALGLWRGPAFGDLAAEPAVQSVASRLDQLHLSAKELKAELLLAIGEHALAAAELGVLTGRHPERERLWAMQMLALYRSGQQTQAMRCFQEARERLGEEMGLEPGPELRRLEQAILRHDPSLDWTPRAEPFVEDELVPSELGGAGAADVAAPTEDAPPAPSDTVPAGRSRPNLPVQLTSFVGRSSERAAVAELLADARLVTLAGTGGCGKTRLSVAVGEDVAERFPDGVWFVDLSAVSDPTLVARAVAGPLGVETEQPGQLDLVCRHIGDQQLLVIFDNCEHVVEGAAEVAEQILKRCPSTRILATSREELRLSGEVVWRVPALSLPSVGEAASGAVPEDADPFLSSEAVELFIERGRSAAAATGFAPTGEALAAVARICRRVDGIPLAIELAAALVGSFPVVDMAARLEDRLSILLDSAGRQGIPRHRTLKATLDWSFDLLDEPDQTLFVQLGVFVGDFTLAATEGVGGGADADPLMVMRGLGRLVATSMVTCVSGTDGAARYRMLETIRQYALEKLSERGELDEARRRHARYYVDFAAEAERHVHGGGSSEWLARVTAELPNLRAAVTWAMSSDDIETGLRLAGSLRWFFARMALLDEASRWLEEGLRRTEDLPPELRLMALTCANTLAFSQGEFSRTKRLGEEGVAIARELDDDHQLAIALILRGTGAAYEGELDRAEECFQEAKVLCEQLGDRWGTAWMLTSWSTASRRAGRHDLARRQVEEALEIFKELGDRHGQVVPLITLAFGAQEENKLDEALELANDAMAIAMELGDRQFLHISLCVQGRIELALDHPVQARQLLLRSIREFPGAHTNLMLAIAIEGLAGLSGKAGRHREVVVLLSFAQGFRERWQIGLSGARKLERDGWCEAARAAIADERTFDAEAERGRSMELDDAVDLAERATASFADPSR